MKTKIKNIGTSKMKNTLLIVVLSILVLSGMNLQAAESAKIDKTKDVVVLENVAEEYKLDNFTNTESENKSLENTDRNTNKTNANLDSETKLVRKDLEVDEHRNMQKSSFGFSEIAILCIWGMTIGLSALYVKKIKKLS